MFKVGLVCWISKVNGLKEKKKELTGSKFGGGGVGGRVTLPQRRHLWVEAPGILKDYESDLRASHSCPPGAPSTVPKAQCGNTEDTEKSSLWVRSSGLRCVTDKETITFLSFTD